MVKEREGVVNIYKIYLETEDAGISGETIQNVEKNFG